MILDIYSIKIILSIDENVTKIFLTLIICVTIYITLSKIIEIKKQTNVNKYKMQDKEIERLDKLKPKL